MLGLLQPDQHKEFETHLASCTLCQREMKLEGLITQEFEKTMDPGQIEHIVLAKLRLRREMNKGFSWGYAVRGIAYGLVAATLGVIFIHPFLSVLIKILNQIVPMMPEPQFGWLKSFEWIESVGSITAVFSNLYVVGGIGVVLLIGSMVFSIRIMRAQFSLSR
jgi:hypothetical protein